MARPLVLLVAAAGLCLGSSLAVLAEESKPATPAKPDAATPAGVAAKTDEAKTDGATDGTKTDGASTDGTNTDGTKTDGKSKSGKKPDFMDARKKREEALKAQILSKFDKNGNGKLDPDEREASKNYVQQQRAIAAAREEAAARAAYARSMQNRNVGRRR